MSGWNLDLKIVCSHLLWACFQVSLCCLRHCMSSAFHAFFWGHTWAPLPSRYQNSRPPEGKQALVIAQSFSESSTSMEGIQIPNSMPSCQTRKGGLSLAISVTVINTEAMKLGQLWGLCRLEARIRVGLRRAWSLRTNGHLCFSKAAEAPSHQTVALLRFRFCVFSVKTYL